MKAILIITLALLSNLQVNAADKAKPYPLQTCVVTNNGLESMGGSITKVYQGQEVKFCCKPCIKKFEANPAKYLAKLKSPKASS